MVLGTWARRGISGAILCSSSIILVDRAKSPGLLAKISDDAVPGMLPKQTA